MLSPSSWTSAQTPGRSRRALQALREGAVRARPEQVGERDPDIAQLARVDTQDIGRGARAEAHAAHRRAGREVERPRASVWAAQPRTATVDPQQSKQPSGMSRGDPLTSPSSGRRARREGSGEEADGRNHRTPINLWGNGPMSFVGRPRLFRA
jgi:hypothetical protein